eukprot:6135211-Amphidinium_carterae.1
MLECLQGLASEPWGMKWLALRELEQIALDSDGAPLVLTPAEVLVSSCCSSRKAYVSVVYHWTWSHNG